MKPIDFKLKKIVRFKNLPNSERILVQEFFHRKKNGFYVDIGANHPTVESQTWHLEKLGWDGLLIEPLPFYGALLSQHRKGKVIQHACSSPGNHNKILKLLVAGGHSTLNSNPIAIGTESNEYIDVTCKTLDSILEENNAPINFDFLSVDIENHEMEMFKGFDIRRWQPKLILLEDHVTHHKKHRFMTQNGYHLLLRTGLNSWYVPQSDSYKFSFLARLEIFRKYWLGLPFRKIQYGQYIMFYKIKNLTPTLWFIILWLAGLLAVSAVAGFIKCLFWLTSSY